MLKPILFAVIFTVLGLLLFAVVAPFVYSGDHRRLGALAFPIIVLVCGTLGYLLGRRSNRIEQARRSNHRPSTGSPEGGTTEVRKEDERKSRTYDY